jgi:DAACS family dicarboxylate/amino acid:cation (Na+ or H+) symporter
MVIIGWALKLAPIGAGCLVFGVAAQLGVEVLKALAAFVAVVIGGLLIQLVVVYSSVLKVFGGISPLAFFRKIQEAMIVAFTTSSSSATLSTSMKVAQDELRLSPQTANFVLTVGATGNQNGTALFEGVVVLFLAQVFKVDLSLGQQFIVVLMAVLAGVGTAGVPGGSIPLIIVVLKTVDVPDEGIAIILGVDRLLDMSRTLVNVVGDLVVATCVDSWNRVAR